MTFPLNRRQWLAGAGVSAAILSMGARAAGLGPDRLFTLGVASGEPLPDGVLLWTRLAPAPLQGDGGMPSRSVPVRWQVAADEGFARIVASGTARARPEWGHSVHVAVSGLQPGRPYWYRFIANGEESPIGRTRTAPARGAAVERLRVCFASCQKYEAGHYAAWRHMVAEEPDLILFLGDYIYEGAPNPKNAVRLHQNPEPVDLAGYRVRYATYKLDPLLQGAHHAAPWAVTWDDHEVANDYGSALDENNSDPARFLRRRAAAYQAYYEHLPLRPAQRPHGPDMQLYRTLDWGRLAQFQIVDDRQYRGARACQPPELVAAHRPNHSLVAPCADLTDPARSMLGERQERWLLDRIGNSGAQWNLLAQQTQMHPQLRTDPAAPGGPLKVPVDNWVGYPVSRDRILRRWAEAGTSNPVALGGDIHAFAAADLRHPDRPDGAPVASEFVGGSISSLNLDKSFKPIAKAGGVAFAENEVRGYGRLDIRPQGATILFRGLADALREDSAIRDLAGFALEAGRPGLHVEG
ncbi:alkaline phosphatase D family protein [Sphingobium sufflavum]|uniref:alkaline phosphatase D family protein n=1 Tax=Sphingobium sufflavum TaxID=1129547 RepID=UPI001F445284|nr:alkaline phosphatase D family protein [Sphingobium sufflavum]MCE7797987.1 alkaline phosphatase D family protein [Sphingobium sufflavum]